MKKLFKILFWIMLVAITITGAVYGAAYYAIAEGWTDVEGRVDENNNQYQENYLESIGSENLQTVSGPADSRSPLSKISECQLKILDKGFPSDSKLIRRAKLSSKSEELISRMIFSVSLKSADISAPLKQCAQNSEASGNLPQNSGSVYPWANTEEWPIINEAIGKDRELIDKAAAAADIEPRLLAMPLAVEQLRLYFSQREYYEKFFKPMKILVSTSQMAWGVMAIKQKSAVQIENNLKDENSIYYPGKKYHHLLDFDSSEADKERERRLNNDRDHYWSYLYGAVYLKELQAGWQKSGFPIDKRPEIIATLYNLGFEHSVPKKNPEVGGSDLDIAGSEYTFGGLGFEIYYSGQLQDLFPYH